MQVKKLLDEKHKILETFNPSLLKQLKLVSKISLQVGLIAVISLTLMLFILLPKFRHPDLEDFILTPLLK